jgi:hypothetical protein
VDVHLDKEGRTGDEFLQELFRYAYCDECGGDVEHHMAELHPDVGWFARCLVDSCYLILADPEAMGVEDRVCRCCHDEPPAYLNGLCLECGSEEARVETEASFDQIHRRASPSLQPWG